VGNNWHDASDRRDLTWFFTEAAGEVAALGSPLAGSSGAPHDPEPTDRQLAAVRRERRIRMRLLQLPADQVMALRVVFGPLARGPRHDVYGEVAPIVDRVFGLTSRDWAPTLAGPARAMAHRLLDRALAGYACTAPAPATPATPSGAPTRAPTRAPKAA
jgi:hypothetical protein